MTTRRSSRRQKTTVPRSRVLNALFGIGDVLADQYEIRGVLGSGGMGQVFDAHDRALNRRVAIKAHWPHLTAFPIRKEAQALAAIRDPAVVTVHALAKHDGIDLLIMERISGMTLADRLERTTTLPLAEATDILARLADALAIVHAAGIAHRDVKPANIMLAPRGRLVLTDFGIFLPEFDGAEGDSMGTADYMAPEAIQRNVARGGAYLVDVYAFGVVAFEVLTGRRPFVASKMHDLLHKQLCEAPVPVSSLRADVPRDLEALVEATLQKDPGERPPSMESIAAIIRSMKQNRSERAISVLIAEDDRTLADALEGFVAEIAPDSTVRVARDGTAVLAHLRQSPPDLLLLDLGLPAINGVELCMQLRGDRIAQNTRIVALSAAARQKDVALLAQLGINTFIRKGNDLLDRVESVVRDTRISALPAAP